MSFGKVADRVGRGKNNSRDSSSFFRSLRGLISAAAFRSAIGAVNKAGDTLTGGLVLGGSLDTGATGQVIFPATQNASAGANTLDDYEEGTFTPSWTGLTLSGSLTTNTLYYTKIGRLVSFTYTVQASTSLSTTAGTSKFSLPFTVSVSSTLGGANGSTAVGLGNGLIYVGDSNAYPAATGVTGSVIVFSGSYHTT